MPDQTPVALPWAELAPYEQQQGGYWQYGSDIYGRDKTWIPVTQPLPDDPAEVEDLFARRYRRARADLKRAQDTLAGIDREYAAWKARRG